MVNGITNSQLYQRETRASLIQLLAAAEGYLWDGQGSVSDENEKRERENEKRPLED
jgi:hypothetical protein